MCAGRKGPAFTAMWFADESGFYFHTGTQKRFFEQL
jgi:hypothetical protein